MGVDEPYGFSAEAPTGAPAAVAIRAAPSVSTMTARVGLAALAGVLSTLALILAVPWPALAASPPAWELISSQTPAQIPLAEPVDQVESVTVAGEGATPYVGHFSLECENEAGEVEETRPLRYAASAAEVRVALEAVSTIGDGNVKVTGGPRREGGRGQKGLVLCRDVDRGSCGPRSDA